MRLYILICTLGLFITSGCVKVKKKEDDKPAASVSNPAPPFAGPFEANEPTVQVIPQSIPQSYHVRIVPSIDANAVRRFDKDTLEVKNFTFPEKSTALIDIEAVSGKTYLYMLGRVQNDQFVILKDFEVYVPKDLVIENDFVVPANFDWKPYARLFVLKKAKLITSGLDHKMEMLEVYFEDATILSFPAGTKSQSGHGRSGGKIEITTAKIHGQVTVQMNGEDGADGAAGQPFDKPAEAASSQGYERGICMVVFPGKNGQDGLPGGNGGSGGHSGQLLITAPDDSQLKWTVASQTGRGGRKGMGGPGQIGGSEMRAAAGCNGGGMIPGGQNGRSGPDGREGQDGIYRQSCFYKSPTDFHCN